MFMLSLLWKIPESKNYILLNFVPNNIWVGFLLRVKLILGDSTETLSGFQTQDKILDLLSTPELLFMEDFDKKKIIFLEVIQVHFLRWMLISMLLFCCIALITNDAMHYAEPTWLDQLAKKPHKYSPPPVSAQNIPTWATAQEVKIYIEI